MMVRFLLPGVSLKKSGSCRSARVGVACVLSALVASCATGIAIDDDVSFIPEGLIQRPAAPAGASTNAEVATEELTPASEEMNEEEFDENLARGDQPGADEPNASPSANEEPEDDDSDQVPPDDDEPIVDPDVDEPDVDEPDPGPGPITPPNPVPNLPPVDDDDPPDPPNNPPAPTDPGPNPLPPIDPVIPPVLPAGHCLVGWEGSSCDTCSGQTQSDRLACRVHIDCYIANDCDPLSCGSLDAACGVNSLNNGLAPKEIADTVYSCMCAP